MLVSDVAVVIGRIDAVWPPKQQPSDAERAEWARYLQTLDRKVCDRAIDDLKLQLGWRPSMADFRSAYWGAASQPSDDLPALPAGDTEDEETREKNARLYGERQEDWIYCWRCDMAISMEERATEPHFREGRGLHHRRCPSRGSAPSIPKHQRMRREEAFAKGRVT